MLRRHPHVFGCTDRAMFNCGSWDHSANVPSQTGKDSGKYLAPITPTIGLACKEMFYTSNLKREELGSTCRMIALALAKIFSIAPRSSAQSSQIFALNSRRLKTDDCCIRPSSLFRLMSSFWAAMLAALNLRSLR